VGAPFGKCGGIRGSSPCHRREGSRDSPGSNQKEAMRMYSRLMNVIDLILVDGFPVIVALGLAVILIAAIANALG
jgi:hypothetical protein